MSAIDGKPRTRAEYRARYGRKPDRGIARQTQQEPPATAVELIVTVKRGDTEHTVREHVTPSPGDDRNEALLIAGARLAEQAFEAEEIQRYLQIPRDSAPPLRLEDDSESSADVHTISPKPSDVLSRIQRGEISPMRAGLSPVSKRPQDDLL